MIIKKNDWDLLKKENPSLIGAHFYAIKGGLCVRLRIHRWITPLPLPFSAILNKSAGETKPQKHDVFTKAELDRSWKNFYEGIEKLDMTEETWLLKKWLRLHKWKR
jgi:hypothetical protein